MNCDEATCTPRRTRPLHFMYKEVLMKSIKDVLNGRAVQVTVFSSLLVFGLAGGPVLAQQGSSGQQEQQSAQPMTQPGQEQQSVQVNTPPGQEQQARADGADITVR